MHAPICTIYYNGLRREMNIKLHAWRNKLCKHNNSTFYLEAWLGQQLSRTPFILRLLASGGNRRLSCWTVLQGTAQRRSVVTVDECEGRSIIVAYENIQSISVWSQMHGNIKGASMNAEFLCMEETEQARLMSGSCLFKVALGKPRQKAIKTMSQTVKEMLYPPERSQFVIRVKEAASKKFSFPSCKLFKWFA